MADKIATREAYGNALAEFGGIDNDIVLAPLKTRIAQLCPLGLIILEILRQGTRNSFVDTLCRQNRYS